MTQISLTSSTMSKVGKYLPVNMEVLTLICYILNCNIGDIVDELKED
ncbi:MAG: helix-turn-helix domain-containing protein [Clostridium sp.]